MECYKV